PHATVSAPSPIPSLGSALLGSLSRPRCWLSDIPLRGLELRAVSKHGVHDDGKPACEGDARLAHGSAPTNAERSLLERQIATIAGEHDIGGLVQQRADPLIADFGDAAGIVDLTGLPSPGNKAQVGADITRAAEGVRFVDGSDKGERRHVADTGYRH